jgi:hypothetical protein
VTSHLQKPCTPPPKSVRLPRTHSACAIPANSVTLILAVLIGALKALYVQVQEYFARTERLEERVGELEAQLAEIRGEAAAGAGSIGKGPAPASLPASGDTDNASTTPQTDSSEAAEALSLHPQMQQPPVGGATWLTLRGRPPTAHPRLRKKTRMRRLLARRLRANLCPATHPNRCQLQAPNNYSSKPDGRNKSSTGAFFSGWTLLRTRKARRLCGGHTWRHWC